MNAVKENTRIKWVDTAKGLGIFLVVFAHVNSIISNQIYLFHMPLFFFLSGMFFKNNQKFQDFLLNKIQYLVVPFFVFLAIAIPIRIIYYNYIGFNYEILELLRPSSSNVPLWFLPALFLINIIFYFEKFKYINYGIIIIMVFGAVTFGNEKIPFQTIIKIIYCLIFFSASNFFWKNKILFLNNLRLFALIALVLFSFGVYLTLNENFRLDLAVNKAEGEGPAHVLFGLSGIFIAICICYYLNSIFVDKPNQILVLLNFVGLNSLLIFGLHWIFIQPLLLFSKRYVMSGFGLFLTIFLIGISIGIGYVLKIIFPKNFR